MYSARRRSARRKKVAGFSLIEAMVTTGIMSTALLGLSASSVMLTRSQKGADMTSAATALVTERLELLRSMPLGSPGHASGTYAGGTLTASGAAGGPYTMGWVISAKDTPTWGLKTATVTASWTYHGAAKSVRLAAYVRCSSTPCP